MAEAFRILKDASNEPRAVAGTTVYGLKGWDYGLARDDATITGMPHKSVTLNRDGDYPSFTIPEGDLEPIADEEK